MTQPLHYVEDGILIWEDGGPTAWFSLGLRRHELLSRDQISQELEREIQRLAALTGLDVQLVGVPRGYSVSSWIERLRDATPNPNPGFEPLVDTMVDRISQSEMLRRNVYVGVSLQHDEKNRWGPLAGLLKAPDRWLSLSDPRPKEATLDALRQQVRSLRTKLQVGALGAEIATAGEIRWLIARTFWRGLPHVQYAESRRSWGGQAQALLEGALVENHHTHLKIQRPLETGEFWCSILSFSRMPDRFPETGGEWLYEYEETGIPTEFSVRFRVMTQGEALRSVGDIVKRTIDQKAHIEELPDAQVPRDLEVKNQYAEDLQFGVSQEREQIVSVWPRLMVTALSETDLQRRVQALIAHYHDYLQVDLVVPSGDQWELFKEMVPGAPFKLSEAYRQHMNLGALAGAGATANTSLGDLEGPYIGRTSSGGQPVHFDPHRSPRINRPTLIGIFGTLGTGKSVAAYVMAKMARSRGTSVVLVDPKEEANGLIELCREDGRVNVVRLDEIGAGMLDPYRVMPDPMDRHQLASTMLQAMLGHGLPAQVANAIKAACGKVARDDSLRSQALSVVLDVLQDEYQDDVSIRTATEALRATAATRWGRVCFSMGAEPTIPMLNALTVLQFRNLPLPPEGLHPDLHTDEQRLGTALVHAMAALAGRVIDEGTEVDRKMVIYDDALPILQHAVGRAILERDTLRGRSKNMVPVVISQNASHMVGDTLASNLGAALVFRLPDAHEAAAGCRVLDIPDDEEHILALQHVGPEPTETGELPDYSEAFFRDASGEVGRVQFDVMRDDWLRALNTTPGRFIALPSLEAAEGAS